MLPNFLIVGAEKAGTTTLATVLAAHPDQTPFEAAPDMIPSLKNCSRYFYQIEQYLPYTNRRQWHIVVLEELIKDPDTVMGEVFQFLQVDTMPLKRLPAKNVMDAKRRPPMLITRFRFLKPYLPPPIARAGTQLAKKIGKKVQRPTISRSLYNALMQEFTPEVQKLGDFCNKDLMSIWHMD